MIKNAKDWVVENRVLLISAVSAFLLFSALYLYRLGSLVRGDSIYESKEFLGIENFDSILHNISLAPLKCLQFFMTLIDDQNSTLLRLISVAVVLLAIYIFYLLVNKWYTHRVAVLATLLFAASSYSLNLGRFGNQDVLYYLVIPSLLLFGAWLKTKKHVVRMPYILPFLAVLLYLPGFIYLIILLPVIFRKRLLLAWKFVDVRKNIVAIGVSAIMLVPLVYSLIINTSQIKEYFAVDRLAGTNGIKESLLELANIPNYIFYNGLPEHYRWLTGTPILDIATAALLILGIYSFVRGPHTLRARILLVFGVLALIIISTSTIVTVSLLVPLVYILVASGIVYLMESWFTVFPRNPAARNTAIGIMAVFLILICSFQLQRYFIAWPNAPATKAALSVKSE